MELLPTKGHDYERREMLLAIVPHSQFEEGLGDDEAVWTGTTPLCMVRFKMGGGDQHGSTFVNMGQHGWWLSCRQGAAIY